MSPEEAEEPSWVVRAGVVTAQGLISRSAYHIEVPGLFGFSVQHQLGRTIEELARAGRFPNPRISVTTMERLIGAATSAGYTVRVVRSPGRGYHHTVVMPDPVPFILGEALSQVFSQRLNPARVFRQ